MHVHIAGRDQRQAVPRTKALGVGQQRIVVAAVEQTHAQPHTSAEPTTKPGGVRLVGILKSRQQNDQAGLIQQLEIGAIQLIGALALASPTARDQSRETLVGEQAVRQQYQARPVAERDLGTDDELEAQRARRDMGTHHTRQRAFVGQGQRLITEPMGLTHQLLGMGGTAQKGEIAEAMEFSVSGQWRSRHKDSEHGAWIDYCI